MVVLLASEQRHSWLLRFPSRSKRHQWPQKGERRPRSSTSHIFRRWTFNHKKLKYNYGRGHPTQEVGPGHPQVSSGHSMLCYVNRSQHYITTSFRFLASLINTWCSTQGQGNSTGTPIELPSLGLFLWVMSVLGKISTVVLPLSIQLVYVKSIFLYSLINSLIKIILPAQVKGKGIDVISSSGMWFETCIGDNDCLNNCFSNGGR